ncbi:MAG: hypothetical protein Q9220_003012 [cf. Caloplaca sp. 1 TL-2023]
MEPWHTESSCLAQIVTQAIEDPQTLSTGLPDYKDDQATTSEATFPGLQSTVLSPRLHSPERGEEANNRGYGPTGESPQCSAAAEVLPIAISNRRCCGNAPGNVACEKDLRNLYRQSVKLHVTAIFKNLIDMLGACSHFGLGATMTLENYTEFKFENDTYSPDEGAQEAPADKEKAVKNTDQWSVNQEQPSATAIFERTAPYKVTPQLLTSGLHHIWNVGSEVIYRKNSDDWISGRNPQALHRHHVEE